MKQMFKVYCQTYHVLFQKLPFNQYYTTSNIYIVHKLSDRTRLKSYNAVVYNQTDGCSIINRRTYQYTERNFDVSHIPARFPDNRIDSPLMRLGENIGRSPWALGEI